MKKMLIIMVLILPLISACLNEDKTKEGSITQEDLLPGCKMRTFTLEHHLNSINEMDVKYRPELKSLINQEYADKFNALPLCMSFCNGKIIDENLDVDGFCRYICNNELERSKRENDWFAVDDLYEVCTSLGIILPE
jgi:hypothetical protein